MLYDLSDLWIFYKKLEKSKLLDFLKVASEVILKNLFIHLKISIKHLLCVSSIVPVIKDSLMKMQKPWNEKWDTFMEIICY